MFSHTRPPKGAILIEANPINRTEVNSSNQNLRKQTPSTDQKATVKPCKGVLGLAPAKKKWVLGLALAILRKCLSWVLGLALAILRCWVLGLALAILRCWVLGLALAILRKCLSWVLGLALAILRGFNYVNRNLSKQEEKSPDKVKVSWQPSEMWSVENICCTANCEEIFNANLSTLHKQIRSKQRHVTLSQSQHAAKRKRRRRKHQNFQLQNQQHQLDSIPGPSEACQTYIQGWHSAL